jgi:hypothetical protein
MHDDLRGTAATGIVDEEGALLEREALRLCDRYVNEVVLGFSLCPWAEPALRAGRVGRAVCLAAAPAPEDCLRFFQHFSAATEPSLDIGLLLFPRHAGGWVAFDGFAERVRRADREQRARSGAPTVFLVAAFHPDGAETFSGPHQLVSFLRRTPDPMLQLVRAEIIDRVKQTQALASEAVAQRNHDALVGAGVPAGRQEALQETIASIRADRNATYARLGLR